MSDIANLELPKNHSGLSVGIIMDGNGRWAASRGLPRLEGHRRGVEALRAAVRAAPEIGVRYLTLYSFSLENWSRPKREVLDLMGLLKRFIRNDLSQLHRSNVKIVVIGEQQGLSSDIIALLSEAQELTKNNDRLTLVIAFNYGSRQEILHAVQGLARRAQLGQIDPSEIDLACITNSLQTAAIPDPDVIIRTSGEQRLSNFLLWQAAYAEFIFLPIYWPDFDRSTFEAAITEYWRRNRRFGGLVRVIDRELTAKTGS